MVEDGRGPGQPADTTIAGGVHTVVSASLPGRHVAVAPQAFRRLTAIGIAALVILTNGRARATGPMRAVRHPPAVSQLGRRRGTFAEEERSPTAPAVCGESSRCGSDLPYDPASGQGEEAGIEGRSSSVSAPPPAFTSAVLSHLLRRRRCERRLPSARPDSGAARLGCPPPPPAAWYRAEPD